MQSTIDFNREDSDEKLMNITEYIPSTIESMMDQIKIYKSPSDKKGSPKSQDTTTVVPDNNMAPPL